MIGDFYLPGMLYAFYATLPSKEIPLGENPLPLFRPNPFSPFSPPADVQTALRSYLRSIPSKLVEYVVSQLEESEQAVPQAVPYLLNVLNSPDGDRPSGAMLSFSYGKQIYLSAPFLYSLESRLIPLPS